MVRVRAQCGKVRAIHHSHQGIMGGKVADNKGKRQG
jgi:hypothetical protein